MLQDLRSALVTVCEKEASGRICSYVLYQQRIGPAWRAWLTGVIFPQIEACRG